ncbi:cupin domain-containing protein [Dyella sp.]|jgi:mannose-6-phosphate isomerase-like protein (cupin superfamily)|uniref:cupin domain-containing protein n=1 Tax=Dyella sp. TaxID=1869338 RepID=UPI002C5711CD|nr:cupin domain-containing protein [Dyella sp.]HTC26221.1 cupin domain-containing protein [Dyella sp.]
MQPDADWLLTLAYAKANLPENTDGFRFYYGLRHGSMKTGIYAPRRVDTQTPHKQDELYIVISGSGDFIKNEQRCRFQAHDVLFVEAGIPHRFENFTDDFATWVVFWGPDGGEQVPNHVAS